MASNTGVSVRAGYGPFFSFITGFRPESEIAATEFYRSDLFDWRYVVKFDDDSGFIFGFPNDDGVAFSTNAEGHLILASADFIPFAMVYGPGAVPGPADPLVAGLVDLATGANEWVNWVGSPFAADFVANWLVANNIIGGQNGTAPDNAILDDQVLLGYSGDDFIVGGGGDDTFFGGPGSDLTAGGAGDDTFIFEPGDYAPLERINGSQGFFFDLAPGEVNTIEARASVDFSTSHDIVKINRLVFNGATALTFTNALLNIGARQDGAQSIGILADTEVVGDALANALTVTNTNFLDLRQFSFSNWTAGVDTVAINVTGTGITRSFAPDVPTTLSGLEGRDTLTGGGANDLLQGGEAADVLDGGDGLDTATYAGSAAAVAVSLATNANTGGDALGDTLLAVENLVGSGFDDALDGNDGDNRQEGLAGDDAIMGLAGFDTLIGGEGNDTLNGGPNPSNQGDFLFGGPGDDTYHVDSSLDFVDEGNFAAFAVFGFGGTDTIISTADFFWDLYSIAETLHVSEDVVDAGNDGVTIVHSVFSGELIGHSGTDIMFGRGGSDAYRPGGGVDFMSFSTLGVPDAPGYVANGVNTLVMEVGNSYDIVFEFEVGRDKLNLEAFGLASTADLFARGFDDGAGSSYFVLGDGFDYLYMVGLELADLQAGDFIL